MPPKDKYTDPKLRDEVKQEVQESDKGGAPGQWSARKAQFMAKEYKKRGGSYNTDKEKGQDESQKSLSKWGEEDWQTKEGSGNAKQKDGTQKRYLPKKAWDNMSEEEKKATDQKKQDESKEGKQHVSNTGKAKESRKKANKKESEEYERKQRDQQLNGGDAEDGEEDDADNAADVDDQGEEAYEDDNEAGLDEDGDDGESESETVEDNNEEVEALKDDEDEDDGEDEDEDDKHDETSTGQKRSKQSNGTAKKKQKTSKGGEGGNAPKGKVGSKHMDAEEPAPRGSADRLPKKGDSVTWKAMPGYVDGKLLEILTKDTSVDGKSFKASKQDPKLKLSSNSSGKVCVHKPDACFYE